MKKKLENFIFYYKYHLIALILILIIVVLLLRDKSGDKLDFVIVDDTSCINLTAAENMMRDFEKQQKIKSGATAFRYKSMYPNQENYKDISFEVAGISDYEACFTDGTIDMVITSADRLENTKEEDKTAPLEQVLSDKEMNRYEKYLYYIDGEAVGIVFNKCKKAEEYFGDNYPTGYHYILQVAAGSAEDEQVKKFLRYLIGE